jgi:arsenate reductase (thioredoxin)
MRLYRVLFVCIGNACRSQMAEAFARRYGSDVMVPASAGIHPCGMVAPATCRLMLEKNIDLDGCTSKGLAEAGTDVDLIVNMSGYALPKTVAAPVRVWEVEDPIGFTDERHREVRDEIERRVQILILELRKRRQTRAAI